MNKSFFKNASIGAVAIAILTAVFQYFGLDIKQVFPDEPQPPKPKQDSVVVTPPPKPPTPSKDTVVLKPKIFLPKLDDSPVIQHSYFTLAYSEKHEQAKWVAYKLDRKMLKSATERTDDFRPDPNVTTGSATPSDYSRSGYDRGHLCPAADMSFNEKAMSETFFMSNMSPQMPPCNRGIWKELEEQVRDWANENKELQVVTGPVLPLRGGKKIGKNSQITIPTKYYKVLLDNTEPNIKAIGFVIPNAGSNEPLEKYAVSIDEVETLTGLDFFPDLPNQLEAKIEKNFDVNQWKSDKQRFEARVMWTQRARFGVGMEE
ncbi:MAG: DNA/RNA non-specific endonuclease [Bacteroidia bacterium]